MKRRELLTGFMAGSAFTVANGFLWQKAQDNFAPDTMDDPLVNVEPEIDREGGRLDLVEAVAQQPDADADIQAEGEVQVASTEQPEGDVLLDKVRNFENEFADDIYVSEAQLPIMHSVLLRLQNVERAVGHGNYNLISFDDTLRFAKRFSTVGEFTRPELDFVEQVFFTQATDYGFLGDKVISDLTHSVVKKDTFKVPYSGHYIFRGEAEAYYDKLKKDVGDSIILTSGIRSNVKQLHLFLAKCVKSNGNLSKASRSLAPPGHSYHGIGDFDVGKIGGGISNFTDQFAQTDEFKRMQDLGYVQIRYTADNRFGVRFEPWHIKVV